MQKQSAKIKELVQDLNLVSQLEYEMQPLHKEMVRLSKLLRSYVADLLNTGISDSYNIGIKITPDAENAVLECDARLISRAVNNLVQNSMKHNPQGCEVCILLQHRKTILSWRLRITEWVCLLKSCKSWKKNRIIWKAQMNGLI